MDASWPKETRSRNPLLRLQLGELQALGASRPCKHQPYSDQIDEKGLFNVPLPRRSW